MKKVFIFLWVLGFNDGFLVRAQINFANVCQTPLLLNPSLTGSRKKPRVASALNYSKTSDDISVNGYISFDKTFKKKGIGYGIYYNIMHELSAPSSLKRNNDLTKSLPKYYLNQSTGNVLGGGLSGKYNVRAKGDVNKVRLTISPSIFAEYTYGNAKAYSHFEYAISGYSVYNLTHPDGVSYNDTSLTGFIHQRLQNHIVKTGFGVGLNTSNLMLLLKVSHIINHGIENNTYQKTISHQQHSYTQTLYGLEETVHLAYSISKGSLANFSFIPMLGIGTKQYLNLIEAIAIDPQKLYSLQVQSKNKTSVCYAHASCMLRIYNALLGATYTRSESQQIGGINVGFQNNKCKLIYCFMWSQRSFNELSLVFSP